MKKVFGALSPTNYRKVCYIWPELVRELANYKEVYLYEYELKFRQMKSVFLRKGLLDCLNRNFLGWHIEVPYEDYLQSCLTYSKRLDKADEMYEFLKAQYNLDFIVNNQASFFDVFFLGYLIPLPEHYQLGLSITSDLYVERQIYTKNTASIVIESKISKNELHRYIDKNWKYLNEIINKLPINDLDMKFPSVRDLRIVELRDALNKNYKNIVEIICDEFSIDNFEGKINEDSIKTTYHRTHERLAKLIPEVTKH